MEVSVLVSTRVYQEIGSQLGSHVCLMNHTLVDTISVNLITVDVDSKYIIDDAQLNQKVYTPVDYSGYMTGTVRNYKDPKYPNIRKHVSINMTVPMARFKMEIALSIRHGPEYVVHHIDHNCDNDEYSNLLLCTKEEHQFIHRQYDSTHKAFVMCPMCGFVTVRHTAQTYLNPSELQQKMRFCTGNKCAHLFRTRLYSNETIKFLMSVQIPLTVREFNDGRVYVEWINPLWLNDTNEFSCPIFSGIYFGPDESSIRYQALQKVKLGLERGFNLSAIAKENNLDVGQIRNYQRFYGHYLV